MNGPPAIYDLVSGIHFGMNAENYDKVIIPFKCTECGNQSEEKVALFKENKTYSCPSCGDVSDIAEIGRTFEEMEDCIREGRESLEQVNQRITTRV